MQTTLYTSWTVRDICQGFVYNEYEGKGLFGLSGKLVIQPEYLRERILNAQLTIYICEGGESEIKAWFKTINIAGVPLNEQELSNAIHSGLFVTRAKEEFSNSQNANIQKWSAYITGDVLRQDFLRTALKWVSRGDIDGYMSRHRYEDNISELKAYFNSVIDWVSSIFENTDKTMRGLEWGELYEKYHRQAYDAEVVSQKVRELLADDAVTDRKGIYEYVLGGCQDTRLLNIRLFDERTKNGSISGRRGRPR